MSEPWQIGLLGIAVFAVSALLTRWFAGRQRTTVTGVDSTCDPESPASPAEDCGTCESEAVEHSGAEPTPHAGKHVCARELIAAARAKAAQKSSSES